MTPGIHPAYSPVVFRDNSAGYARHVKLAILSYQV